MARLLGGPLVIAVVAGCAGSAAPAPPGQPGNSVAAGPVRTFSEFLDEAVVRSTSNAEWAAIARDNTIIVLNSWDYRLIPALKHDNPRIQVWLYKDLSGVRTDDCTTSTGQCGSCPAGVADSRYLSSGLGYCWVLRKHPDWFLLAAVNHRPLRFRGYPSTWETDYGSAAYQRQWAHNVISDVRAHGWDGVAVDNALTTADAYGVAARYPTDASVQAATYSALRLVGSALRRAGVRSVFNVGFAPMFAGLWQRWLTPVGGLEQEYYLSYTTEPDATGAAWLGYQSEVSSCAAAGKSCWFHVGQESSAVTARAAAYGLASYLLAADGRQVFATGDATSAPVASLALGVPVKPMIAAGQAFLRYFTLGVAVVNPSPASVVVPLGGIYLIANGHPATTISLGPGSGVVLRAAAAQVSANAAAAAGP
jgi:hypothetical protein